MKWGDRSYLLSIIWGMFELLDILLKKLTTEAETDLYNDADKLLEDTHNLYLKIEDPKRLER
jgi:hypothetical protein